MLRGEICKSFIYDILVAHTASDCTYFYGYPFFRNSGKQNCFYSYKWNFISYRRPPHTTEQNSPARVHKTDTLDLSDSDEEIVRESQVIYKASKFKKVCTGTLSILGLIFIQAMF